MDGRERQADDGGVLVVHRPLYELKARVVAGVLPDGVDVRDKLGLFHRLQDAVGRARQHLNVKIPHDHAVDNLFLPANVEHVRHVDAERGLDDLANGVLDNVGRREPSARVHHVGKVRLRKIKLDNGDVVLRRRRGGWVRWERRRRRRR